MTNEYEPKLEVYGKSVEDCYYKLNKKFGQHNYTVVDRFVDERPCGFLGLQSKPQTVLKYTINTRVSSIENELKNSVYIQKPTEEEILAKNREAILQNQQNAMMTSQISQMNTALEEMSKKINNFAVNSQEKHPSIKKIDDLLELNEFSFSFITMIDEKIRNEFSLEQLDNFDLVERRVIDWIGESISVAQDIVYRPPHVYIIVGPTGVGKTTTLVKLAVQFVKNYTLTSNGTKPRICFITTDTMRVGAKEQLERWGKRMEVEVYKAEKTDDLKTLYEENQNVDAIFVDTSGFSPNDATHIAKMKLLIDVPGINPDIYLALTASTKSRDLKNIMQNYEPFGYKSVIVTKCDESSQFGNVISVLNEKHKAISYVTNGQIASRDIIKANVIDFLIRLEGFKVDRVHIEDKFGE